MTILQINTSMHLGDAASTRLADAFVGSLRERDPDARVIRRDLAAQPLPHLDAARFAAFLAPPAERTASQQAVVDESDALIAELRAADVVVIGLPMYNFGIPSQLKAYFDHIARAGVTFRYTEHGPVGLLTGKKAYVFATRGGVYADTTRDTQAPYVREFLGFLGIDAVEFVYAEGMALGPASRDRALATARDAIQNLLPSPALAA